MPTTGVSFRSAVWNPKLPHARRQDELQARPQNAAIAAFYAGFASWNASKPARYGFPFPTLFAVSTGNTLGALRQEPDGFGLQ